MVDGHNSIMRKDKLNMIKNSIQDISSNASTFLLPPEKLLKIVRHRCIPAFGKKPFVRFKNKPASTNEQLEIHFRKHNPKAWAARTGDLDLGDGILIVLDIDNPNLVNPGYNPSRYYVKTRKGVHWYLWVKEETGLTSGPLYNENGEKVGDLKVHKNSYVMAPYSVHEEDPTVIYLPSPALVELDLSRNLPDVLSKDEVLARLREYLGFCPLESRRSSHRRATSIKSKPSQHSDNQCIHSNSEFGISPDKKHIANNIPSSNTKKKEEKEERNNNNQYTANVTLLDLPPEFLSIGRRYYDLSAMIWDFAKWDRCLDDELFTNEVLAKTRQSWESIPDKISNGGYTLQEAKTLVPYYIEGFQSKRFYSHPSNYSFKQRITDSETAKAMKHAQSIAVAKKNAPRNAVINELYSQGNSMASIAQQVGLSRMQVHRIINAR